MSRIINLPEIIEQTNKCIQKIPDEIRLLNELENSIVNFTSEEGLQGSGWDAIKYQFDRHIQMVYKTKEVQIELIDMFDDLLKICNGCIFGACELSEDEIWLQIEFLNGTMQNIKSCIEYYSCILKNEKYRKILGFFATQMLKTYTEIYNYENQVLSKLNLMLEELDRIDNAIFHISDNINCKLNELILFLDNMELTGGEINYIKADEKRYAGMNSIKNQNQIEKNADLINCYNNMLGHYLPPDVREKVESNRDYAMIRKYINTDMFEVLEWKADEKFLNELVNSMYNHGITNELSVKFFLATICVETGHGQYILENGDSKYFNEHGYDEGSRGAGLMQITGVVQEDFVKENNLDISDSNRAETIANYYAIESATWYWADYEKKITIANEYDASNITGENVSINKFITEYSEHKLNSEDEKKLYFAAQCAVNGTAKNPYYINEIVRTENDIEFNDIWNGDKPIKIYVQEIDRYITIYLPNGWNEKTNDYNRINVYEKIEETIK